MNLELSHFSATLIFAVLASIVFGITQRNSPREMVKYGLYCLVLFVGGVMLAGWLMSFLKH